MTSFNLKNDDIYQYVKHVFIRGKVTNMNKDLSCHEILSVWSKKINKLINLLQGKFVIGKSIFIVIGISVAVMNIYLYDRK